MAEEDDVEFVVAFDDESGGEADVGEGSGTNGGEAVTFGSQARAAAVLRGRLLGEEGARMRGEVGAARSERIDRAIRYAELEWDGSLGKRFRDRGLGAAEGAVPRVNDAEETRVTGSSVPAAPSPRPSGPDWKKGK